SGGGSLTGGYFNVIADATGGSGAVAGSGYGDAIQITSDSANSNLPTTLSFATMTLSASGSQGVGESAQGYGGDIDLLGSGGMLSADSLSVSANGGGFVSLDANQGFDGQA